VEIKMSENFKAFKEKFRIPGLVIHETSHWVWSLRPVQATIGAGILSLKRAAESFSDISAEEGADLSRILKKIEATLKKAFNYQRINYLMLMMVDYHVHFHIIPRYENEIRFSNRSWKDLGWPKPPILDVEAVADATLFKIRDFVTSKL
jgi:diadenosine tetraphosphate (Ap4A) HIT family hydrolase